MAKKQNKTDKVTEKVKEKKTEANIKDEVKEAVANALKEQQEASDAKRKKKRKIIRKAVTLLIIIAIIIFIFFFLKFKVTFKYNNGEEDKEIKVKFLRKIPESEIVKEPKAPKGYTFAGYAETYYLNGEQIETIKKDSKKEKDICKPDFKLDSEKVKCVSEYEFDFENTRIYKNTTIEALWSKNGKKIVKKAHKKQTAPKVEPKEEPKDEGTISLKASDTCSNKGSVTVTATLNNAIDSNITWSGDSCVSVSGSGDSITVSGKNCSGTVTATLNNGSSNSIDITFEDTLSVTLIDYENNKPESKDGNYWGVKTIKTNIPAVITGSVTNKSDALRTEASTNPSADGSVTVKTPCGQSKSYSLKAVIN